MKKLRMLAAVTAVSFTFVFALFATSRGLGSDSSQSASSLLTTSIADGQPQSGPPAVEPGLVKRLARRLHLTTKPRTGDRISEKSSVYRRPLTEAEQEEQAERQEQRERLQRTGSVVKETPPYHTDSAAGIKALTSLTIASGYGEWMPVGAKQFRRQGLLRFRWTEPTETTCTSRMKLAGYGEHATADKRGFRCSTNSRTPRFRPL